MSETTLTPFEEFTSVIEELTGVASSLSQIETAKADAASEKHHELLDGYIQEEQALILKLRGLEQKRMRLAGQLGWDSLTFRQILEKASLRQQPQLEPLFQNLEQALKSLEQSRKAAEQIIQVRLHEIQAIAARQGGASYDSAGDVNLNAPPRSMMKDRYV